MLQYVKMALSWTLGIALTEVCIPHGKLT